jgi:hypothetical protein
MFVKKRGGEAGGARCGRGALEGRYDKEETRLVLWLGLMCSQSWPEARPSMRQVCQSLDGELEEVDRPPPCSFGLLATSQQYFPLRTNQPPASSQQYFFSQNKSAPTTSQTNRLRVFSDAGSFDFGSSFPPLTCSSCSCKCNTMSVGSLLGGRLQVITLSDQNLSLRLLQFCFP